MEQAAQWYALLRSGDATESDRAAWQSWLDADPNHRRAWGYVEAVSRTFEPIHTSAAPRLAADNLWTANIRFLQRRRMITGIAMLTGSALIGWTAWRYTSLPDSLLAYTADYRTTTGEIREFTLSDGTRVWLNTATAFNEDYRTDRRVLHLMLGEILIDTASDPQRPFYVETSNGQLRALGTRFTVREEDEVTLLAVYHGRVQVRTSAGATRLIRAGQQVRFTAEGFNVPEVADVAREAWSRGMLVARNISLEEVVQELRHYRRGHLGVDPKVAGLRVFGNFPLRDTDETLALLAEALPVRIHRPMSWWVSIEPRI